MSIEDVNDEGPLARSPKAGCFKPGRSGNPAGRPKKTVSVDSALHKAAQAKVTVKSPSGPKRITKLDAAALQIANKSASGDTPASKLMFSVLKSSTDTQAADANEAARPLKAQDQEIFERMVARIRSFKETPP